MNESEAKLIASQLTCWKEPVSLQPLAGGISNHSFLAEENGRKYVARINGDVLIHGVLRINDYNCNRAAAEVGVAPPVYHFEECALVTEYIAGKTLAEPDIARAEILERILELLLRTHHDAFREARGPICAFWPFRVCRDYAHILIENGRNREEIAALGADNEMLESKVGSIDLVLGHNDLLAANFIDAGDRLWLIDWEHAGFTSPLFDLANLASNANLPSEKVERLLEAYFDKSVTDQLRHRFQAMSCASLLREAMWAMVSEIYSKLDFDYVAYGTEQMDRYRAAKAKFENMK